MIASEVRDFANGSVVRWGVGVWDESFIFQSHFVSPALPFNNRSRKILLRTG